MRLIGSLQNEKNGQKFSRYLDKQGIANHIETHTNKNWGSSSYGDQECQIWVHDEKDVAKVIELFQQYALNPDQPEFATVAPRTRLSDTAHNPKSGWNQKPLGWITKGLLFVCTALLLFSELYTPNLPPVLAGSIFGLYTSPIEKKLLYDYPELYQLIDQYITLYGTDGLEHPEQITPEGKILLEKIKKTPVWKGVYAYYFKEEGLHAQLFGKIREGEIWRLFTPALLHADLLHLFFNMLWLLVLGKQMEQRLSPSRYCVFLLMSGVFSNTSQYLAGGPNFLGFSGILCGMLTFIWVRQKKAPWEGYQLSQSTFYFMMIFIFGMAFLQLASFLLEQSFHYAIPINIANVAHLSGALIGYLLGYWNYFSWRPAR